MWGEEVGLREKSPRHGERSTTPGTMGAEGYRTANPSKSQPKGGETEGVWVKGTTKEKAGTTGRRLPEVNSLTIDQTGEKLARKVQ